MKKNVFTIFTSLIIVLSSVMMVPNRILAIEENATVRVEYVLPYPGILPDNPLYVLKTFRDKILEIVIGDPIKKAEFYLLQSDKHLNAAVLLLVKDKSDLAAMELVKSDEQLQKSLTKLNELVESNRDWPGEVSEKMTKAIAKRRELFNTWMNITQGLMKEKAESLATKQSGYEEQLMQLTAGK